MNKQSISLSGADPQIRVTRVGGNLQVEGWDQQQLEASGDSVNLGREEEAITASCAGDLVLKMPRGAVLQIDFVGRKLDVRGLNGPVDISFVGSDLELRDLTGQVTFHGLVGGSTRMENVSRVATAADGPGPFRSGPEAAWRKADKVLERAEEQRRRFEKKILHAERKLDRFRVGFGSQAARWKWGPDSRATQAAEAPVPVSDEERLAILKMLQEKKISAEEADRLLAALEGEA